MHEPCDALVLQRPAQCPVKASYWHRVNLGDTDELVDGLIGSEGVLWPRLVADTVCGRLTRRSVGLVVSFSRTP